MSTTPRIAAWLRHPASDLQAGALPAAVLLAVLLYGLPREAFPALWADWMGLFTLYLGWLYCNLRLREDDPRRLRWIWGLGIGLRLIAAPALPVLSDDYHRFLWDGQLLQQGVNPFTILPRDLAADPQQLQRLGLSPEWFAQLNSPDYFTIYPPLLQAIFWLAAGTGSVLAGVLLMKAFVLLAELISLWLLDRLLRHLQRPRRWIAWYALNPLVIVELCGSLHFEALMITALLAGYWWLLRGQWHWSALALSAAILVKLLPLMLLPLLPRRIGWRPALRYGALVGALVMLGFWPLLSAEMLQGLQQSLQLYIDRFEFNAGIWYAVRYVGFEQRGWNIIREAGPWLSRIAAGLILLWALLERRPRPGNWAQGMLAAFTIYFLLSLIVHPWYICTLIALAPLTGQRFPVWWSLWLPATYWAYQFDPVQESMWLVGLEYVTLLVWILIENIGPWRDVVSKRLFRHS